MADKDGLKVAKDYHTDVPFGNQGSFHVKGANNTDWGMKRHLSSEPCKVYDPWVENDIVPNQVHSMDVFLENLRMVIVIW